MNAIERRMRRILFYSALVFCVFGCDTKSSPNPATPNAVDVDSTGAHDVEKVATLSAPPGEAGPFLVRSDALFPTQIFGFAATETHIAIAMQSDVRDVSQCVQTQLPICFQGAALLTTRRNPNVAMRVDLYESDTQSGARVDGVESVGQYFAFAIRDGVYAGDTPRQSLAIFHQDGTTTARLDLTSPQAKCHQIALAAQEDNRVVVCRALDLNDLKSSHQIDCQSVGIATGKSSHLGSIATQAPVRSLSIIEGFDRILVAWTSNAHAYVAFLDVPDNVIDLGASTAIRPSLARGADRFAIAWQGDDGTFKIDAIYPAKQNRHDTRQTIVLNGVYERSLGALVAFSRGYAFAFRHQNTQQIAIVDADLKSWYLADNSTQWRMFSQYGALDIDNAHNGKFVWQTVESLILKTTGD